MQFRAFAQRCQKGESIVRLRPPDSSLVQKSSDRRYGMKRFDTSSLRYALFDLSM